MDSHTIWVRRREKKKRETKKAVDRRHQRVDFMFDYRMHETSQRSRELEETGVSAFHGPRSSAMREKIGKATLVLALFCQILPNPALSRPIQSNQNKSTQIQLSLIKSSSNNIRSTSNLVKSRSNVRESRSNRIISDPVL